MDDGSYHAPLAEPELARLYSIILEALNLVDDTATNAAFGFLAQGGILMGAEHALLRELRCGFLDASRPEPMRLRLSGAAGRNWPPAFVAAVLELLNRPAVAGIERARGVMDAATHAFSAQEARRAATEARVAAGFRVCALPACSAVEESTGQHKLCASCRAVAYCCAEHQALHWRLDGGSHRRECRALKAARATPAAVLVEALAAHNRAQLQVDALRREWERYDAARGS
jgi:hypothetical protein